MLELKNVSSLQRAVSAISSFISEGNFRFSKEGISFRAIDPSQIVLVNYDLPKEAFQKYDIEPTFVGMDLAELNKIMQRILPNDTMEMEITESELLLSMEGEMSRSFKLSLMDISEDDVSLPSTKFDASLEINAKLLKETLKDALLFGTSAVFRIKGKKLQIEARGSHGALKVVSKELAKVSAKGEQEIVSKYSLSFLQNLVKEADNDSTILLELKTDSPLKASYSIGEGKIEFYLAHMIL